MIDLESLIAHLSGLITDDRLELFNRVLKDRTKYITVALENIYQPHNASAVLRTADCFGVQDVHVIENDNVYDINPDVALGSYKWINLVRHNKLENNTFETIKHLKSNGYRIVATTPHNNDVTLDDFDLSAGKLALFFGTELTGLSNIVLENADEFLKIPMYGFTESFNISVSASVILHQFTNKLRSSNLNWNLSSKDKDITILRWLMNTIKKSDLVVEEYFRTKKIDITISELYKQLSG